ncbi:restriction endonuclease subunit S [Bradyrhizobium sp. URHD0069]|uniref:restriction endonuclease subunit S n=1 Tax=Bradyrhizobium sp. URHD0069 TaxID=1380355 RepID=UPI000496E880|nr:restriction endonuclease subunit S [Bradyrhizobium sp. URHD0069]
MLERPIGSKAGWTRVRFDQMATQVNERVDDPAEAGVEFYVGLEHLDPDSLRIRRWGEPTDVESTKLRFQPGDIIFGKRRVYQRKVAVADFEGICSAHAMVLRTKPDVVLPDFLPFFMQSDLFMERALSISVGSLSPTINWKTLAAEEFLLPPIQEQVRSVEVLLAAQNNVERLLELVEAIRIAQLSAFEELLRLKGAQVRKLGSLLTASPSNGFSPTAASEPTGHWVLALSAISRWGYRAGQFKPVHCTTDTIAAVINKGDLVISRSNTRDLVGLPMVFPEKRGDVSYPDTMMRISVDPEDVSTDFLELCLRSPQCRRQIQSFAAGTSSSMLKINGANLRKVDVPLVSFAEQKSILKDMQKFSETLQDAERRLIAMRALQRRLANGDDSGK